MKLTLTELKSAYPELVAEIEAAAREKAFKEGFDKGASEGQAQGAEKERARIKAVEEQALPGHEKLITELKYDGATTGPEAAVKVLAAEKKLITTKHTEIVEERTMVVPVVEPQDQSTTSAEDDTRPFDERIKEHWDKHPETRAEFAGNYENYKAYKAAEDKGLVKIYTRKGGN
jgi:capsid assembly protease